MEPSLSYLQSSQHWLQPGFKLDYVIAGTQKGGTTALNYYLSQHPDICTGIEKEAHFFDTNSCFQPGPTDYRRYHFNFRHYKSETVVGEATPSYMFVPEVPARLYNYNPKLKLIFVLRHPVERAYSHYAMMRRFGKEYLPFSSALRVEEIRIRVARGNFLPDSPAVLYSYLRRGFYSTQIKNYCRYFPLNQMLFIKSEELSANHEQVLQRVYEFLGVEEYDVPSTRIHVGEYQALLSKRERALLLDIYREEITDLESMLGWDLNDWRK